MQTAVKKNEKINFEDALNVLEHTKVTTRKGRQTFQALCPIHADRTPSLTVTEGDEGQAFFYCHACCQKGDEESNKQYMREVHAYFKGEAVAHRPPIKKKVIEEVLLPLTIKQLAEEKGLSLEFLREMGIYQGRWKGTPCVMIPYFLENGEMYHRKQTRLLKEIETEDGKKVIKKAIGRTGTGDLIPYGLDRLKEAREIGHLFLMEGESDCWTLWAHDIPSVGIPGAGNTELLKLEYLEGINSIYAINEKDNGAKTFIPGVIDRLKELEWPGELYIVTMPDGCKDPNELHLQIRDSEQFIVKMVELIVEAKKAEAWQEEQIMAEIAAGAKETAASNVVSLVEKRKENWMDQLDRGKKGGILSTAKNLMHIFANDENLRNKFAYNKLSYKPEVVDKVPWKRIMETKEITDYDDSALRNYLSIHYGIKAKDVIHDVLHELILEHSYHPVREYLSSLNWDTVPRLDTILIDFMGADDTELNRMQTRLSLVGAVARAFEPGCKFDYVLTLKGAQGAGKSTFLQKLAVNEEWFSDSIDDVSAGKESKEAIQGKWIIELGEMAAVRKGDQKKIKQFITSRYDEYRTSYGRRTNSYPRQCIFVASTNDDEPLKDDTGGRRWWIIEVKERWFEKDKKLEVDQIWAEAVNQYKKMRQEGVPITLPSHLEEVAKEIQLENTDRGVLASQIEYILNDQGHYKKWSGEHIKVDETCARHIWSEVLGREDKEFNSAIGRQITAVLNNLKGWQLIGQRNFKGSEDIVYGRQRVYQRMNQK